MISMFTFFVCISICLLSYALVLLARKITFYRQYFDELTIKHRRFTIAVLAPTMQSPVNLFFKGFVSQLKKFASFEFEILECVTSESKDSIYKWSEYVANNNISLIFSLGRACTDTLCHVMQTRNSKKVPIVSGGLPADTADINAKQMQEKIPFTATTSYIGWPERIALLKKVFPTLKRVLVLFRSIDEISHYNLREKNSIIAALRKQHIDWQMHHITNIEKSCELDENILNSIDLVVISHSSELIPFTSSIANTCKQYSVPVFSTDLSASDVFIGIATRTEKEIGTRCAQQAMQILEDGKDASSIPIRHHLGKYNIVVHSNNAPPLVAASVISHALETSIYSRFVLETPLSKTTS